MAAGVVAACKQKSSAAQGDEDAGAVGDDDDKTSGDDDDNANQGTPAEPSNGISCDVQAILENRCLSCHGATDAKGPELLKYEDFTAKSNRDPNKTRGQLAAELMKSKEMPKAPGVATDAEIKMMEDWVAGGLKKSTESCILAQSDAGGGNGDGGGKGDGGGTGMGADAGLCTSGTRWTMANTKSPLMHPGGACIACHSTTVGGPALSFAGTVFPTLHEVDDCNGSSSAKSPVTIIIKDRRNTQVTMQTNEVGNFMAFSDTLTDLNLRAPYTVEIRQPGKPTRKMNRTINGGDCNSCHTTAGNGPLGRIVEPGNPLQ